LVAIVMLRRADSDDLPLPRLSSAGWATINGHCERLGFRETAFLGRLSEMLHQHHAAGVALDEATILAAAELAAALTASLKPN
jgi:hypothetical protein